MFRRRRAECDRAAGRFSLSRSLLFHRIVHRDPFFGLEPRGGNPRTALTDFHLDPRMMENVRALNGSGVPYVIVQLPRLRDLEAGGYRLNHHQGSLLASLEKVTGHEVVGLLDGETPGSVSELFLLPHDTHPSVSGMKYFAEEVGEYLMREKLIE